MVASVAGAGIDTIAAYNFFVTRWLQLSCAQCAPYNHANRVREREREEFGIYCTRQRPRHCPIHISIHCIQLSWSAMGDRWYIRKKKMCAMITTTHSSTGAISVWIQKMTVCARVDWLYVHHAHTNTPSMHIHTFKMVHTRKHTQTHAHIRRQAMPRDKYSFIFDLHRHTTTHVNFVSFFLCRKRTSSRSDIFARLIERREATDERTDWLAGWFAGCFANAERIKMKNTCARRLYPR